MKVVVIIQARMGSSRLPGKVMMPLAGRSVLSHVAERCQAIAVVDEVVIATTTDEKDNPIQEYCDREGLNCYRGSENDVLSRYYEAATWRSADIVVRITSDCPLLDPDMANDVIVQFLEDPQCDYGCNWFKPSIPIGLSVEVFRYRTLLRAYQEARTSYEREHVTPYMHDHPELFNLKFIQYDFNYSHFRWTLDTPKDYELISEMYRQLYQAGEIFSWSKGIELMERFPHLAKINV